MKRSKTGLLKARHRITRAIRKFFDEKGYMEVDTPHLVYHPAIDAHIDAVEVSGNRFLITSPEIQMKMLLVEGCSRIYQLCHAYREGESGPWHNTEFTILEWYRTDATYIDLMDETEKLTLALSLMMGIQLESPFKRRPVCPLFLEKAGWDPSEEWNEDRFFRDIVEKIEPALKSEGNLFLYDFPAEVASMAKLKGPGSSLCERFELYLQGIEIANGYAELRDADQQRARLLNENRKRKALNKKAYPIAEEFIHALRRGLPSCSGIALGVDRLLAYLLGLEGIKEVMAFSDEQL